MVPSFDPISQKKLPNFQSSGTTENEPQKCLKIPGGGGGGGGGGAQVQNMYAQ
jgi:hypothetical protein